MEDILINSLESDLEWFKKKSLSQFKASYIQGKDARLPAKFHVSIFGPFEGTPAGKNIICALEYYRPALNAYACLKASKTEENKNISKYFFDAGISYFFEWHDRKESVISYLAFMRNNTDSSKQLAIIKAKLTSPSTTAYALEKAHPEDMPRKTAQKVIKQLQEFLKQE